jgi:hypothetical protein
MGSTIASRGFGAQVISRASNTWISPAYVDRTMIRALGNLLRMAIVTSMVQHSHLKIHQSYIRPVQSELFDRFLSVGGPQLSPCLRFQSKPLRSHRYVWRARAFRAQHMAGTAFCYDSRIDALSIIPDPQLKRTSAIRDIYFYIARLCVAESILCVLTSNRERRVGVLTVCPRLADRMQVPRSVGAEDRVLSSESLSCSLSLGSLYNLRFA